MSAPLPVVATTATLVGLVLFALALALQPLLWSDPVPSASVLAASRPMTTNPTQGEPSMTTDTYTITGSILTIPDPNAFGKEQ